MTITSEFQRCTLTPPIYLEWGFDHKIFSGIEKLKRRTL
jgi:hypothetical protein